MSSIYTISRPADDGCSISALSDAIMRFGMVGVLHALQQIAEMDAELGGEPVDEDAPDDVRVAMLAEQEDAQIAAKVSATLKDALRAVRAACREARATDHDGEVAAAERREWSATP
jgi:hypothetical protein